MTAPGTSSYCRVGAGLVALLLVGAQGGRAVAQSPPQPSCEEPSDPTADDSVSAAARAAACREYLRHHPDDAMAYVVLAFASDSVTALETLEAGRRRIPNNYWLQLNAGFTLRRFGRYEEALQALNRAAELDSDDADALTEATRIAALMGQLERAVTYGKRAVARPHAEPAAWGQLARAEAALGRHADAVRDWDKAEDASGYRYLSRSGDRDAYKASLALAPDAHVPPSQLGPTLRGLALFGIPAGIVALMAWGILRIGRGPGHTSLLRIFMSLTVVLWGLSAILTTFAIGAAFGALNGDPSGPLDSIFSWGAGALLLPIALARVFLPQAVRPGYGFVSMLLNSMIFAAVVTLIIAWVRRRRRNQAAPSGST